MCVTNGRHLGVNRLLIGGICEPFRWGVDDVGLSDLGHGQLHSLCKSLRSGVDHSPELGPLDDHAVGSLRAARRDRATDRLKAAGLSAYESDPLSALARLGATGAVDADKMEEDRKEKQ